MEATLTRKQFSNGTVNESNVHDLAQVLEEILKGKEFLHTAVMYSDSPNPRIETEEGCTLDLTTWTDGSPATLVSVRETDGRPWLAFSACRSFWTFSVAPGESTENNDFHIATFHVYESRHHTYVEIKSRAPAGENHLHIHRFTVQNTEVRDRIRDELTKMALLQIGENPAEVNPELYQSVREFVDYDILRLQDGQMVIRKYMADSRGSRENDFEVLTREGAVQRRWINS